MCVSAVYPRFLFYESCLPHSENIAGILSCIQNEPCTDCSSLNEKVNYIPTYLAMVYNGSSVGNCMALTCGSLLDRSASVI